MYWDSFDCEINCEEIYEEQYELSDEEKAELFGSFD